MTNPKDESKKDPNKNTSENKNSEAAELKKIAAKEKRAENKAKREKEAAIHAKNAKQIPIYKKHLKTAKRRILSTKIENNDLGKEVAELKITNKELCETSQKYIKEEPINNKNRKLIPIFIEQLKTVKTTILSTRIKNHKLRKRLAVTESDVSELEIRNNEVSEASDIYMQENKTLVEVVKVKDETLHTLKIVLYLLIAAAIVIILFYVSANKTHNKNNATTSNSNIQLATAYGIAQEAIEYQLRTRPYSQRLNTTRAYKALNTLPKEKSVLRWAILLEAKYQVSPPHFKTWLKGYAAKFATSDNKEVIANLVLIKNITK